MNGCEIKSKWDETEIIFKETNHAGLIQIHIYFHWKTTVRLYVPTPLIYQEVSIVF